MLPPPHALTPVLLDNLRIEQTRQRHPSQFGTGTLVPKAFGLSPKAQVAQDGREIPLEPIAEPGGHTTWC
jgi:hypothetical protein